MLQGDSNFVRRQLAYSAPGVATALLTGQAGCLAGRLAARSGRRAATQAGRQVCLATGSPGHSKIGFCSILDILFTCLILIDRVKVGFKNNEKK